MSKTTPMKTATTAFRAEIAGHTYDVAEGERVVADHPLVGRFPEHFRAFGLAEELQIRSDRVADLASRDFSASSAAPLSRAGRAEAEETRFWSGVDQLLTRDTRSAEERREASFYNQALDQLEDLDAARIRDENIELGQLWYGRVGG